MIHSTSIQYPGYNSSSGEDPLFLEAALIVERIVPAGTTLSARVAALKADRACPSHGGFTASLCRRAGYAKVPIHRG
jgi:hypothetical protein